MILPNLARGEIPLYMEGCTLFLDVQSSCGINMAENKDL
jgi:hypothetical protein